MKIYRSGAVTFIAMLLASTTLANAPMPKIGVVGSANEATVAVNQNKEQRSLKTGDDIYLNDTIQTDAKGAAQIMFLDKSALTINPASAVTIDEFVYNPATSSGKMSLNSAKGAMRFIGGALSKKQPVNIKTPVATIGIRGGIADVIVDAKTGATESVFVYGTQMTTENENGMRTTTTQMGSGFSVDSNGAPPRAMDGASIAANIGEFHEQTTSGSTSGALSSEGVDTKVDAVGSSNGGTSDSGPPSNNGGGNSTSSGGGKSDSNSSSESASGSSEGNSGGTASSDQGGKPKPILMESRGTQLNSDGPAQGNSFGPDRMSGNFGNMPNVTDGLPPVQNLISNAAQEDTRQIADNTVNAPKPVLPDLPPVNIPPAANIPPPLQDAPLPPVVNNNPPAGGGGGGTVAPPPTTHRGLFVMKNSTSPSVLAEGSNNLHVDGANLRGDINDNVAPRTITGVRFDKAPDGTTGHRPSVTAFSDGFNYTGKGFVSENNSMFYYQLTNDITPAERISMLTGEQIANANIVAAATQTSTNAAYNINGVSFYDYLPDLMRYQDDTQQATGFYGFNMADVSINPTGNIMYNASNHGLIVDWTNKGYMTGALRWGNVITPGGLVTAFGKVNTSPAANAPVLAGGYFQSNNKFYDGTTTQGASNTLGQTRVKNDIYGKSGATGLVDGMLFETAKPNDPTAGTDFFALPGQQGRQPVTLKNTPTAPSLVNSLPAPRTAGNTIGYAGGVIVQDVGGTETNDHFWNSSPTNVSISRDVGGNSIGATVNVTKVGGGTNYVAMFGDDVSPSLNQAFIRDDIYAMQQGTMSRDMTPANRAEDGALVTGRGLNTVTSMCNSCQYAHWGVWSAKTVRSDGKVDVANMVPYVAGDITGGDVGGLSLGTVQYNGDVLATKTATGGILENISGTVVANINMNTRQILTSTTITLPSATMNVTTPTNFAAGATFQAVPLSGAGVSNATMNGAFFGPNAQNLGGNFTADIASGSAHVTGVYLGNR